MKKCFLKPKQSKKMTSVKKRFYFLFKIDGKTAFCCSVFESPNRFSVFIWKFSINWMTEIYPKLLDLKWLCIFLKNNHRRKVVLMPLLICVNNFFLRLPVPVFHSHRSYFSNHTNINHFFNYLCDTSFPLKNSLKKLKVKRKNLPIRRA